MRRVRLTVVACFCLFVVGLGFSSPGFSSLSPVFSGSWTNNEETVVEAAVAEWNSLLTIPQTLRVTFSLSDLSGNTLGETMITGAFSGLPRAASITIDTSLPISWNLNNAISGEYDALSTVEHELGHALGFVYQSNLPYYNDVSIVSGNAYIWGYQLYGTDQAGESHLADPNDLMYPYTAADVRNAPSAADLTILSLTYGYTINAVPEPALLLLLGFGLPGLIAMRKNIGRRG